MVIKQEQYDNKGTLCKEVDGIHLAGTMYYMSGGVSLLIIDHSVVSDALRSRMQLTKW